MTAGKDLPVTPFLSVFTRHMASRPRQFEECLRSLTAQTDQDFEQIVIVDHVGRGVAWANRQFVAYQQAVRGDYVLTLDDDDVLVRPEAVALLRAAAAESQADIIIFKGDHGPLGILPDRLVWQKRPLHGHISGQDFIVRREVWQRHADCYPAIYAADYAFISELWRCGYKAHWLDVVLTKQQCIGRGKPE